MMQVKNKIGLSQSLEKKTRGQRLQNNIPSFHINGLKFSYLTDNQR